MQSYVVTGGAGFIGSHVVTELLDRGHAVTVVDDFSTGHEDNLSGLSGALEVIRGSVTDEEVVGRAMQASPRAVIHLAALPSVSRSLEAPLDSHHAGATGTVTVLDAARKSGTRVVYAGSSSAYGDQDVPEKVETLRESPLSPYAAAKLSGELYCRAFARVYGMSIVVTRFFNVFGPRQVPDSPYSGVIAAFCFALLEGKQPRIDGDGGQTRDFTYVSDVVHGVLLAADDPNVDGCHTINLACNGQHSINELLEHLADYAGVDVQPTYAPPRPGDVRDSCADISAARALLGYEPGVGFREGLEKTFDWYREHLA